MSLPKKLQLHVAYTEGNLKITVAVQHETDPNKFHVYFGKAPCLSEYIIDRIVLEEKKEYPQVARLIFPELFNTMEYVRG